MDWQTLFNFAGSAVLAAIGWWCRQIWDSVQALKEDVKKPENWQNRQKVPFFSRIEIDSAQTLRAVLAGQRFWPNAKSVP